MKKILFFLLFIVLTVALFVFAVFLFDGVAEWLILPEDYLFYEHTPICGFLLVPLMVIPPFLLAYLISYVLRSKIYSVEDDYLGVIWLVKLLGKWLIPIGVAWLMATYICLTSLTYVTADSIVVTSPLSLKGQEYAYSDVEKIECGFGDKRFAVSEYKKKGRFFYKITLDGKVRVFHMPTTNPDVERYDDTYLELEEFDLALTQLGIPKESSPEGYEHCDFDKVYVDRFLRITGSE